MHSTIFIGVMGVTGAGKSTFIRAVTGNQAIEIGHELTSCTPCVCTYSFLHQGREIILIDTPGFNDTFKSETEVLKDIASFLEKSYRDANIKLSGMVYMHALEDRRMSGSSLRNLKMFRQLCGEQSMQNVIMVSSGWDLMRLTDQVSQGEAKELDLITRREFWQPMISKGARTARFLNSPDSALQIIEELVPNSPAILQIQHELVDDDMDLVDTAAGATVNEELAKLQAKYENQLKEIQQEIAVALQDRDEEMKEILEAERLKFQRMKDDTRRAQDSLKYAQRKAQRQHENELQDLRLALENSRIDGQTQSQRDQLALAELQAQRMAEKIEFEQLVKEMRSKMGRLRREERAAIEAQILQAEQEQKTEATSETQNQDGQSDSEKLKADAKAKKKKKAFKLIMSITGVVGSVTMSALGLGFLSGPLQGLIDFGGSTSSDNNAT